MIQRFIHSQRFLAHSPLHQNSPSMISPWYLLVHSNIPKRVQTFFSFIIFWASLFLLFCVSCFRATFGHSSDWIVASLLKIRRKLWPQLIFQFRGIAYRINHWETYHFSKLPSIKHACRIVSLFHVTHLWSEPVLRMSQKYFLSVGKPSISSRWVLLQWRKAYNGGLNTTSSSSLPTRALILMSAFVFLFLFWSFCAEQRYCISTCVILELAWLVFFLFVEVKKITTMTSFLTSLNFWLRDLYFVAIFPHSVQL